MTKTRAGWFVAVIALLAGDGSGAEWPGWQGPARDGRAPSSVVPAAWPAAPVKRWQVEVGEGYSSPVVAGTTVFTFARRGDEEAVSALALADGKLLWRKSYPVAYSMNPAAVAHGKGPKSSPALGDGKLFTLGITGILSAWNPTSGELLWRKDFAGRFKSTSPLYGTSMSPLVEGKLVIAHVGGHDSGALIAFDTATGKEVWSRPEDGPGYASPIVAQLGGVKQVVTQTQNFVIGVELASGALLWKVPFTTDYDQNIVTPIVVGDLLIYSGLDKGITAIRPAKQGEAWVTPHVWHSDEAALYMSSPILAEERLCGMSHKRRGQLFCLDPSTGKMWWMNEGRTGEHATVLSAGSHLLVLNNTGELIVAKAEGATYTELKRYDLADSATWAPPVPLPGAVLIKDSASVALWSFE